MRKLCSIVLVCVLVAVTGMAQDENPLVRGEDRIDVPAIGDGLCVHNVFQSNMILQRDKPIIVWGWAEPGQTISLSFADLTVEAIANENRAWRVTLPACSASTDPRAMTIKSGERVITLENILIGDLWVLGGQSNMEFEIAKVENGQLEIASANFPNIRLLTIPQQNGPDEERSFPSLYQWSGWSKRHFRRGFWDVCSPETVREMSAIGYVFGRRLHMATQIPIGLIDVSRGGTTVETWTPIDVLRSIDDEHVRRKLEEWDTKIAEFDPQKDLEARIERHNQWVERMKKQGKEIPADRKVPTDLQEGPIKNQNCPGTCYAGMLAPIAGFPVKGAIWHQGYNNCFDGARGGAMYEAIFPRMIVAWRAAFGDPEMPFGIITLCTQGTKQTLDNFCSQMADAGPYIREAQYKTFLDLEEAGDTNVGFAVTYDLRRRWYHPQLKIPAGERIARWALATQYGFNLPWKPPVVQKVDAVEGELRLTFNQNVGAVDDGGVIEGFAIAGDDGKFQPAMIDHLVTGKDGRGRDRKDLKILVLTSALVPHPVHYRYAWARSPMGNVQAHHNTDVPLGTQRTDTWTVVDMYKAYVGESPEVPDTLSRGERRALINALQAADVERQLHEARMLIEAPAE